MSCQQVREDMAVMLLTGVADQQVDEHLAQCPGCRQEHDDLRAVVDLMVYAPAPEPAVVPVGDIALQRLLGAAARERRRRRRLTVLSAVAAVVLLLIVPFGVLAAHLGQSSGVPPAVAVAHPTQFHATNQQTGVTALAALTPSAAGTDIDLSVTGVAPMTTCSLVAVQRAGPSRVLLTWQATYRGSAQVRTGVAVPMAQISRLELVDVANGHLLVSVPITSA
jgi:anti-sigma factor RsiW